MTDRRAVFTPQFRELLSSHVRVNKQQRMETRIKDAETGEWKYIRTEWKDVPEPAYREEILPQTLSNEDIRNDRWPPAIYRFIFDDGLILQSFVQASRDFGAQNLVVDFMGIQRVRPGIEPKQIDDLCWGQAEINEYLPNVSGGGRGRNRGEIRGLETEEPEPVQA